MPKQKTVARDQWAEKYLREQPFMPFGSMMNAYGVINEGKGITLEEFEEVAKKLGQVAAEIVGEIYNQIEKSAESEEVEFPEK